MLRPQSPEPSPTAPPLGTAQAKPALVADSLIPLIGRMQRGDPGALAELFSRTRPQVHARARSITRNHCDAEDTAAEVFEQAWTHAATYDPARGSVIGWLLMMCRSRAIDLLRERKPQGTSAKTLVCRDRAGAVLTTEGLVNEWQQGDALYAALAGLPPLRRQLVVLAYFGDFTHAELATVLCVPLGTVKSHLRRALTSMRRSLGTRDGEGSIRSRRLLPAAPAVRAPISLRRSSTAAPSIG